MHPIICTHLFSLYFINVSVEKRLIPLSVFTEGHLLFNFLDILQCSEIDFECFIVSLPPKIKKRITIIIYNIKI